MKGKVRMYRFNWQHTCSINTGIPSPFTRTPTSVLEGTVHKVKTPSKGPSEASSKAPSEGSSKAPS